MKSWPYLIRSHLLFKYLYNLIQKINLFQKSIKITLFYGTITIIVVATSPDGTRFTGQLAGCKERPFSDGHPPRPIPICPICPNLVALSIDSGAASSWTCAPLQNEYSLVLQRNGSSRVVYKQNHVSAWLTRWEPATPGPGHHHLPMVLSFRVLTVSAKSCFYLACWCCFILVHVWGHPRWGTDCETDGGEYWYHTHVRR